MYIIGTTWLSYIDVTTGPMARRESGSNAAARREKDSYEDQIWFSGSTEEIFDLVCDIHVIN